MAAEVKERSQVTQLGALPINTVIQTTRGQFIKTSDHAWFEIMPHCIDCAEQIDDTWGVKNSIWNSEKKVQEGLTASQYFRRYTVLSRPPVVVHLKVQGKWVQVTPEDALAYLSGKFPGWVKNG